MQKEYTPGAGAPFTKEDALLIGETLEKINERDGNMTARALLEEARPENSPVHHLFEWSDTEAAEKWRLHTASRIIIYLEVKIIGGEKEVVTNFAYNVKKEDVRAYVRVEDIKNDVYVGQIIDGILGRIGELKNKLYSLDR